jgi:hypothetical protein
VATTLVVEEEIEGAAAVVKDKAVVAFLVAVAFRIAEDMRRLSQAADLEDITKAGGRTMLEEIGEDKGFPTLSGQTLQDSRTTNSFQYLHGSAQRQPANLELPIQQPLLNHG